MATLEENTYHRPDCADRACKRCQYNRHKEWVLRQQGVCGGN